MSTTMRLTDDAIRAALTPDPELQAPAGLAAVIRDAIDTVPQRQPGIRGWRPTRRTRLVLQLVVVGLLLLGAVGTLLLLGSRPRVAPAPTSVLTYHGGPERTGIMPGPGPVGELRVEWEANLKGSVGPWSPVVDGGTVYIGDQSGFVSAFDEATGTTRWQVPLGAPVNSGVTVADALVIVSDDAGVVHALDPSTGSERWNYVVSGPVHSAAAVLDGTAYLGDTTGVLHAVDVATGRPVWTAPVITAGPISRSIAAAGGLVYAGSGGGSTAVPGSLGAYDTRTGALRWTQPLESGNTTTPAVADGRVFVSGGLDASVAPIHRLYAFDAATGQPAWASPFAAPSGKVMIIGAVADGTVYATGTDGSLYALDASTGAQLWQVPIGSNLTPNAGYVNGILYVTSDDARIHRIDVASRADPAPFEVNGVPSAPAVVDGRILVATGAGKLVSLVGSSPSPATSP